jgi:hypothetical protein
MNHLGILSNGQRDEIMMKKIRLSVCNFQRLTCTLQLVRPFPRKMCLQLLGTADEQLPQQAAFEKPS